MTPEHTPRRRALSRRAQVVLLLAALAGAGLVLVLATRPTVDPEPVADAAVVDVASTPPSVNPADTDRAADAGSPPRIPPPPGARAYTTPTPLEPERGREPLQPGVVQMKAPVPLEESRGLQPLVPAVVKRPAPKPLEENPNGLEPLVPPVLELRNFVPPSDPSDPSDLSVPPETPDAGR